MRVEPDTSSPRTVERDNAEKTRLAAELDQMRIERDDVAAELDRVRAGKDDVAAKLNRMQTSRDALAAELDRVRARRDALAAELDQVRAGLDERRRVATAVDEWVTRWQTRGVRVVEGVSTLRVSVDGRGLRLPHGPVALSTRHEWGWDCVLLSDAWVCLGKRSTTHEEYWKIRADGSVLHARLGAVLLAYVDRRWSLSASFLLTPRP